MKRVITFLIAVALCLLFVMPAFAQEGADALGGIDLGINTAVSESDAAKLDTIADRQYVYCSAAEIDRVTLNQLNRLAQNIYDSYGIEVYLKITNNDTADLIADTVNFYNNYAVGANGIALGISATQWYIHTSGSAVELITENDENILWDAYSWSYDESECIASFLDAVVRTIRTKGMTPTLPERKLPRLVDEADLLDEYEEGELLALLDEISERQQFEVAVVTVDDIFGKSPQDYADDFYDYNGYGFGADKDGVLLLVNMGERDWHVTTTGYGITAITDAGLEYISEKFLPDLSNGYYSDSFKTYANLIDQFVTQAKTGEPYDIGNMPKGKVSPLWIPGAAAGGAALGQIPVKSMKNQLKSVGKKKSAADYRGRNGLMLAGQNDAFLYSNVKRRYVDRSSSSGGGSSTHFGSSGSSHGGGGGKF